MRLGLLSLVGVLAGCGDGGTRLCTASIEPALVLRVVDAGTGQPIADGARGAVVEGEFTDTLRPYGSDGAGILVSLAAADERPGTYQVWVERQGYQPSSFVAPPVEAGSCHVETLTLDVRLVPAP